MKSFFAAVRWLGAQVSKNVSNFLGQVTWQPPHWPRRILPWVKANRYLASGVGVALLALILVGLSFWLAACYGPKPVLITWFVNAPQLPDITSPDALPPLAVTFNDSVARLNLIGQDLPKEAVLISPPIAGNWHWISGNMLTFTPTEKWAPDAEYQIRLTSQLFSPHKKLEAWEKNFHTPPFTVAISDAQFYVNPKNPAEKQITATLTFSYPVDRASLERNFRLDWQSREAIFANNQPQLTFTYDPDKRDRVVYIRSAKINLPQESGFARLTAPTAIYAAQQKAALAEEQTQDIRVPSLYTLFNINSAQPVIVTNNQGDPEQALIITTSVGIKPEVLQGALHVKMLPRKRPGHNDDPDPYPWQSPAEVDATVLAHAISVKLTPVPTEQEYATEQSFKIEVPEGAYLYTEVDRGTASAGDFTLNDKFASVSAAPVYPRQVKIAHEGALLALSGERKLTIQTRGVEQIEYQLARITPGQINHLVSQTEGTFQNPTFVNSYYFDESNVAELITKRESIALKDSSEANYSALDFSEFTKDTEANHGKLGLFLLHVYGRKPDQGYYKQDGSIDKDQDIAQRQKDDPNRNPLVNDELSDQRLILLTDLGIVVKDNDDSTHDVFVQSIKTGEPVDGAKVEVLGKNGIALVSVETDEQGHASIPSLDDFSREKQPVAYVVHQGDDVSFLPFGREDRELNLSRFDIGGISSVQPNDLTAFVFTDRGIYRPGDTANLGFIVKQHNWQGNLQGLPVVVKVYNPAGKEVQSKRVTLPSTGFFASTFTTQETSPTGTYQVNCYLTRDKDSDLLLGSQNLQVKEFLPDRLKMTVKLSATNEGWISPDKLSALVSLQNLYGAAAVGNRITGKLSLSPTGFYFEKYPDYTFADPYEEENRKPIDVDLTEQKTDDSGNAMLDLTQDQLAPAAWDLSLLTEGFENGGGRSVKAYAHALVSPRSWLLGIKPDGEFSYLKRDSQHAAKLLAIDAQLKPLEAATTLSVKRVEVRYVSALVQKPNGNYGYESVRKEIPEPDEQIVVPKSGASYSVNTHQAGNYLVKFYDDKNELVGTFTYNVAGEGNLAQRLDKNAELSAKLSKPEYNAGEEIEVQITAPYTGAGLITIERDKVYAWSWFQSKTTSSVQKIRIPAGFEGNGYLNVTFVRALDSKEIYLSPLSYAVLPFRVNREARHTIVQIDAPKVALPGQPLEWTVTASRPTPAVVYAVDEGILQVANYTLPDPLEFFFQKEALGVGTRQTLDQILPEYSIARMVAAAGGDENRDLLAHHLNPFKRKHDAPVVFWSGLVDLGPQGKKFTYNVPDYFAGTIRLMVVAASPDAVGSTQTKTQVRGPFVIQPNVPTFVAPGDTFEVSSTVANNVEGSGAQASVAVKMETTPGLEIVQAPDATETIPEGHDIALHWTLRAKNQLGNADLTISAQSGDKQGHLASHLSIRPPSALLTTVTSGYFLGSEKQVDITRTLYPEFREGKATISVLPQGLSRGLSTYLEHYEYGCTEQLMSKAFPTLVSDLILDQPLTHDEVQKHLNEAFAVIATRQSDDGAIGLWEVEPNLHFDFPSVWVVHLLLEAKERGYDVPEELLTRAMDHLEKMAEEDPQDFYQARMQAYAIYLLTRNGQVTTNYLEHNREWFEKDEKRTRNDPDFYDWHGDYAGVLIASTYALLKNQDQADALIARFQFIGAKVGYEYDFYDGLCRDGFTLNLIARHFPERLKKITPDDLQAVMKPIMDGEFCSISAAYAIMGLDSYARSAEQHSTALDQLGIKEKVGEQLRALSLSGTKIAPSASYSYEASALLFQNGAGHQLAVPGLFYQFTESGFEKGAVTKPISEGIEVSRDYYHGTDLTTPVHSAALGEELTVVLRVRGTGGREITNVTVLDLLPGGFEIVPESITPGPMHNRGLEEADVREDRLNIFGTVDGNVTEVHYRIKATNKGTYIVPPPQAEAMYHLKIHARGVNDTIAVE